MTGTTPESVTLDTSVMCRPVERRFVMATWELLGARVPVLPNVASELHGVMYRNEFLHWQRSLASQERREETKEYPTGAKDRIATAAAEGARQWVEQELQTELEPAEGAHIPSALRPVRMSTLQREQANGIAAAIPNRCFAGPSKDNHFGDRVIIAQAIVMGFSILASRNRASIRRNQVNEWAKESMGLNADLVREAEDAVHEVQGRILSPSDKASLAAVLLACRGTPHPRSGRPPSSTSSSASCGSPALPAAARARKSCGGSRTASPWPPKSRSGSTIPPPGKRNSDGLTWYAERLVMRDGLHPPDRHVTWDRRLHQAAARGNRAFLPNTRDAQRTRLAFPPQASTLTEAM